MLKVMRSNLQHLKWILVAIVVVFVVSIFVDWGAGGAATSQSGGEPFAARVNGETVSIRDFDRALYYAEKNYEQMYRQPLTDEMRDRLGIPTQVMNSLVDQKLLLQEAKRLSLSATAEEVRKRILELPVLNPDGKFVGPELYERYITGSLGYASAADFEEDLRRELTLQKMEGALQSAIVISVKAAEQEFRRMSENTKIRYLLYPADRALAGINVTPAEVEQYYKTHLDRYAHAEQRQLKYLLADYARIRSLVNVEEPAVRARYEGSKNDFKVGEGVRAQHILIKIDPKATPAEDAAARSRAAALVAKLRAGADFAALAKENSGDPGSAAQGGDLGFFERGAMVAPFDAAAFSLPIGQVSDPIKTDFGYHIIKVSEKRPAGFRSFDEVAAQLRSQMIEQQTKDQGREQINQVRARLEQSKPKSEEDLRTLANEKISLNDTKWFGKGDPIIGIGPNPAVSSWVFSAKAGDVGPVIGTSRGPIVPYLAAVRPAGVASLEEVRAKVENDLRMEKARAAAEASLRAAMPAPTVDALAAKLSVTPLDATVNRDGYVSGLTGSVQNLVDAARSARVGDLRGPLVVPEGAVVFQVIEQVKGDPTAFEKNKDLYISSIQQREARKIRTSLLARLRKNADVVTNARLVETRAGRERGV